MGEGKGLAQAAEELVRASGGSSIDWTGIRLATVFQPIYCVRRESCLGFEALASATGQGGAVIGTEEFFGRTPEEERSLLDWACRALHLRNYATVDPGDRTLFINVHPEAAVKDARRGRDFSELIRYYGLVPQRVCVEILEAPCSDEWLLRDAVDGYRDLGVSIAMDDFGLGRSDFDRVARLRPDIVKVNRALLARSVGPDRALAMLPGMIDLLHEAQARVTVEGIETRTEALLAVGARADYLQGYIFGYPQSRLAPEGDGLAILDQLLHSSQRQRVAAT